MVEYFFIVAHYLVAALQLFHVLCRTLGLHRTGAFIGAVIFAFGSQVGYFRSSGQPELFF